MTDTDLLRGAQAGDAEAWRGLYQRYLPEVWRQACLLTRDSHAAEDITSEAMLGLLRNLDRLDASTACIGGWLRSAVRGKAADHYRKALRFRAESISDSEYLVNGSALGHASAPLEIEDQRERVLAALDKLADREQTVLQWKYLDALATREIALRLGASERSVEATLYRARREFRRLYGSEQAIIERPKRRKPDSDLPRASSS
jgi:RNA polymerase sigma factor (sigma-70 family)